MLEEFEYYLETDIGSVDMIKGLEISIGEVSLGM